LVLDDLHAGAVADRLGALLEGLDPPDVHPDRRVELQRLAARGGLRGAEEDTDLLAQLVDEDRRGARRAQRTGDLAERLRHEARLEADVAVTHLPLDLGLRHERRDRVDDDDVDRARADQHVHDLERLLAGVRLGDQQRVGVDTQLLGVLRVERVLGVDERGDAPGPLGVGDGVQRDRRLAARLRAVDLDDTPAPEAADAQGDVEGDRTGGDHLDRGAPLVAETHDRPLAELAVDLAERRLEGLGAVCRSGHVSTSVLWGVRPRRVRFDCAFASTLRPTSDTPVPPTGPAGDGHAWCADGDHRSRTGVRGKVAPTACRPWTDARPGPTRPGPGQDRDAPAARRRDAAYRSRRRPIRRPTQTVPTAPIAAR